MTHPGKQRATRMLFTGLSKKNCVRQKTFDELLAVFTWDLENMATGRRATCRHDNTPWRASDAARGKLAAKEPNLTFRAALCEVRGDWKFYKECFNFPAWNTLAGITPTHTYRHVYVRRLLKRRSVIKEGARQGDHAGICWRCDCTPDQIRNVGLDAPWRQHRRAIWEFLRMLRVNGITPSPLLNAPWIGFIA